MSGVLILTGPTAAGKTELAIALARRFDAEIVGADSRQIYRGMPIGTAAPSPAQQAAVPHHLIGFLDPAERYSAARFSHDAVSAVKEIHARGKRAIVAGGTGFYVRALTGAVDLSARHDDAVRSRLAHEARIHDTGFLYEWLQVRDPRRAAMLDRRDGYRILRALEIAISPLESQASGETLRSLAAEGIHFATVFLNVDAAALTVRIGRRTDEMLRGGLLEEAQRIGPAAMAANAVGYPQALAYLAGWCTYEELRRLLLRATSRYAKRQAAWFRADPTVHLVSPEAVERVAREKLGWV